jgi:hypothetical protein
MKNQVKANEFTAMIIAALDKKIATHFAENAVYPDDVTRSKKKVNDAVSAYLIECEKTDFAAWVETAPCKSIMRAINFLSGVTSLDKSLGGDLIAQALIETSRAIDSDTLPLELVKHQTITARETEGISDMTKGKGIIRAQRRMSAKTALSMISNRAGKNGYLQYLGMVSRSTDKAVVINKVSPFYVSAFNLLHPAK